MILGAFQSSESEGGQVYGLGFNNVVFSRVWFF